MTDERRKHDRHVLFLECSWTRDSRIADLSISGCYVDARHVPPLGAQVEFTTTLDGEPVTLRGIVVHTLTSVGFALEFNDLDD